MQIRRISFDVSLENNINNNHNNIRELQKKHNSLHDIEHYGLRAKR